MSENVDALIKEGIRKSRAGDKAGARALLEQATEIDPNNEKAWMWLSGVVDTPEDQRVCLENVLYLNPNNENAKRGLAILDQKHPQPPAPEPQPDPYQSSSSAVFSDTDSTSGDEYDEWRSSLGSSAGGATNPFTVGSDGFDDVFGDVFADSDDDPFDLDDQLDATALLDEDDPFGQDTLDDASDPFEATYDPFESTDRDDLNTVDVFGADDIDTGLDDFDDLSSSGFFTDADELSDDMLIDSIPGAVDEVGPGFYFRQIPEKIKKTRLPGKSSVSVGSVLLLLVLIAANAVAVVMLTSGT